MSALSASALLRTVTVSLSAPVLVLAFSCFTTSSFSHHEEQIEAWKSNVQLERHEGGGWGTTLGPEATLLHQAITGKSSPYSELSFDLFIEKPLMPQVRIGFVPPAQADLLLWLPLPSSQLRKTGWNQISVSFDSHEELFNTEVIALSLSSPGGPNRIVVRDFRLIAHSYLDRLERMLSAFFRHQPLSQRSNNYIESPLLAGHGVLFTFWLALLLALAVLGARKFALHEPLDLARHAVVTLLVVVVLVDLRNGVDSLRNLAGATTRRLESTDLPSYLGTHEKQAHGFSWFGPALGYLQQNTTSASRIVIGSGYVPGVSEALTRLVYYAHPALRAANERQADIALCYGPPLGYLTVSSDWKRVHTVAATIDVYRRSR